MDSALAGFGLGLSLIMAIGAQNAFVLRQGIRHEHVFAVALTCALSDAILIAAGVSGFGILVTKLPLLEPVMRWGGAAFLIVYGARAFLAAWKGGEHLDAATQGRASLKGVLATCLLLTWANPHVYLDTVVLLGSVAAQYQDRLAFALGAMFASFLFFFSLGYGARMLAPLFARPAAWRALDIFVGCIMWTVAASLLL
ncbi:LysE/ArgO family amino acid transporter [Thalassovita sp.]|uniref:LysE/ArgO family amino acid transporter n=1 Tax=Thalassovita sp. TaxID=1979401 RepID=UPI0029DE8639|nr:LysE/ArgO family amino acid transporter [Thalassovita sp.]